MSLRFSRSEFGTVPVLRFLQRTCAAPSAESYALQLICVRMLRWVYSTFNTAFSGVEMKTNKQTFSKWIHRLIPELQRYRIYACSDNPTSGAYWHLIAAASMPDWLARLEDG